MRLAAQIPYLKLFRKHTLGMDEIESLIDIFPQAALIVDNETNRVVIANAKITELSAYTRSELSGQNLQELIHPDSHEAIGETDTTSISTHNANFKIRNGKSIPVQITTYRLDYRNNWSIYFLARITEQNLTLGKNNSSQKRWESINLLIQAAQHDDSAQAINQVLNIGRAILSADTIALYFGDEQYSNQYIRSHSQGEAAYLPNSFSNKDLNETTPDLWQDENVATKTIQINAKKTDLKYLASIPLSEPNTRNGYLLACARHATPAPEFMGMLSLIGTAVAALYDQDSQNIKTIVANFNFSPTESNEEILQIDYIMENLRDGIIVVDNNLIVTNINDSAETLLGFTVEESVSLPIADLAECTPSITPALKAAQHGFPSVNLNNIQIRNRKGKSELANIRVLPILDNGEVIKIIILINDLSAQEAYKIRTEQLENHAFLGEISAIFAHEVRNPINNISTGLQLMSIELEGNEKASDQIGRIQGDLERLTDLTKSVLSFSGKREYRIRPVNISKLLSGILSSYKTKGKNENINFLHTFPEKVPTIQGDQRALEQVFVNIISNAVNAMQSETGEISIKIKTPINEKPNSMLEIFISDTGPGIPEEVLKHIFEPFYTTKREGTGLGLAISKRIIEAHKGKIAIESFPGGTIFSVKLPIANNK